MKKKLIINKNYKLFKYNLLKLQMYSKQNGKNFSSDILEFLEIHFKQLLKIIYEYHINYCHILFIGFPSIFEANQIKFINHTNHNFIFEKSWVSGIFRNRLSILKYLKSSYAQKKIPDNIKLLLELKAKPHLVVIFNQKLEVEAINEFYKSKIPIVVFGYNSALNRKIAYKIPGNSTLLKNKLQIIYFCLLCSLLKQKPISKRKLLYKFVKLQYFR